MKRQIMQFAVVAVVCAVTGGVAFAADTIADDQTDGNGALISGSENFLTTDWTAHVDYAVYAPENYPGDHYDTDTHYIYAYQVFKDTDNDATEYSSLDVALASGADVPDYSLGYDDTYGAPSTDDEIPDQIVFLPLPTVENPFPEPTSAHWGMAEWPAGTNSPVLLFSSPYTYTWDSATVDRDNGGSDTHNLPSPLPEPAVLILLCGGVVPILLKHRRKVRAKI